MFVKKQGVRQTRKQNKVDKKMRVIDISKTLAKNGHVLTGRSALALRTNWVSSDPRVIMEIYNGSKDIYCDPRWLIPEQNPDIDTLPNKIKIASINQAICHSLVYDYDDTFIDEMLESMDDRTMENFLNWLEQNDSHKDAVLEKLTKYSMNG